MLCLRYMRNREQKRICGLPYRNATLGFVVMPKFDYNPTQVNLSLEESIVEGFSYGYWTLHDYVAQFKYIFTKKGASQVGGFGAIGNLFPSQWDWQGFWSSTALISIILAFMNVLPIPALDGGHVMFLLHEMMKRGRKPNDKFMEYAHKCLAFSYYLRWCYLRMEMTLPLVVFVKLRVFLFKSLSDTTPFSIFD